jgi:hypothetical protein
MHSDITCLEYMPFEVHVIRSSGMKLFARLILIIGLVIWLGPAILGFFVIMILLWALLSLAGWDKPDDRF